MYWKKNSNTIKSKTCNWLISPSSPVKTRCGGGATGPEVSLTLSQTCVDLASEFPVS